MAVKIVADSANEKLPRRRRLQFGLRTLMIAVTLVAVPCGYIGWQLRIIRARDSMLSAIVANGGGATVLDAPNVEKMRKTWGIKRDVPLVRQLLGDIHVHLLALPDVSTPDEYARAVELFPEAWVFPP